MKATTMPFGGSEQDVTDVEAREVNMEAGKVKNASRPTYFRPWLRLVIVIIALCGVTSWFRIDSLNEEKVALATQVSALDGQVKVLENDAKSTVGLRRELAATKSNLAAEIARKNGLAVENTTLKGRITQGERDLAQALEKLKAFEGKQPKQKPKK